MVWNALENVRKGTNNPLERADWPAAKLQVFILSPYFKTHLLT